MSDISFCGGWAVQLFTPSGEFVATVAVPNTHFGVVCWQGRYFAAREGRYVEVQMYQANAGIGPPQGIK